MANNIIADKLTEYFENKGITQTAIAEELGVSKAYVNSLFTGSRPFGKKQAEIWENKFGFNRGWLLTGEGEMLKEIQPKPVISFTEGVPYYDIDFLLGFDELEAPWSESPDFLVRMPGYERATLWCNASGNSMDPEISNGDIIALQRIDDFSFLPYGDIYAIITTNGLRTIKRLGRSSRPGHYRLIPTNPAYDPQDIPLSKILHVYRVMGAMKSF